MVAPTAAVFSGLPLQKALDAPGLAPDAPAQQGLRKLAPQSADLILVYPLNQFTTLRCFEQKYLRCYLKIHFKTVHLTKL